MRMQNLMGSSFLLFFSFFSPLMRSVCAMFLHLAERPLGVGFALNPRSSLVLRTRSVARIIPTYCYIVWLVF
ncbi:hypothetical protein F5Y14DRAFT_408474, partial [Nemania sp. NC0429]